MVLNEHLLLFSCSAILRELHYVLILHSFQEKCIPQRCFNVCHIMEEKVIPTGKQPVLATKQPSHVHSHMEGKYALYTYSTEGIHLHYMTSIV